MSEDEKVPLKDKYAQEQLSLESCLEAAVNLLDFFAAMELEYYNEA